MHFPALPDRSIVADPRRWLPATIEVALVALLAVQLVRAGWLLLAPPTPRVETPTTATGAASTPALPRVDLFFRSTAAAADGSRDALGYTLHGVRRDGTGGGSAILARDDLQASFAVGGEIADGIVLETVGIDHAVLLAGGRRHRLELPEHHPAGAASTSRPAPRRPAPPPVRAPAPAPAAAAASPNLPELIAKAGLRPSLGGGFTLSPDGDAAVLAQAGLAPGDVLLAVNGQPLTLARLPRLASELEGRREVEIRYRRDGQLHTTLLKAPR